MRSRRPYPGSIGYPPWPDERGVAHASTEEVPDVQASDETPEAQAQEPVRSVRAPAPREEREAEGSVPQTEESEMKALGIELALTVVFFFIARAVVRRFV